MLLQGDLDEAEATVNELNNEIPRQQDILEQVPTILQQVSTILKSVPIIVEQVLFEKVVTSITYLFSKSSIDPINSDRQIVALMQHISHKDIELLILHT